MFKVVAQKGFNLHEWKFKQTWHLQELRCLPPVQGSKYIRILIVNTLLNNYIPCLKYDSSVFMFL